MDVSGITRGRRKWIIIGLVALFVAMAWSDQIDRRSRDYVDSAVVQALGAFATARTLNAVITVAKSVQVGAVVSVQPLEILDPLHDLVEQYSSIMKLAIGSLITQKLILEIVASTPFKIAVTILGLLAVASLFLFQGAVSTIFVRCFAFVFLLRFLFVLTLALSALIDVTFVNPKTESQLGDLAVVARQVEHFEEESDLSIEQKEILEKELAGRKLELEHLVIALERQRGVVEQQALELREAAKNVKQPDVQEINSMTLSPFSFFTIVETIPVELSQQTNTLRLSSKEKDQIESRVMWTENRISEVERELSGESPRGWFSGLRSSFGKAIDLADFDELKDKLEVAINSLLNLMALFVFKTLIMPLIFLLMLLRGFRYIWGIDVRTWLRNVKTALTSEPVGSSQT